jgi:hypothetical protein
MMVLPVEEWLDGRFDGTDSACGEAHILVHSLSILRGEKAAVKPRGPIHPVLALGVRAVKPKQLAQGHYLLESKSEYGP